MITEKKCKACEKILNLSEFTKSKNTKDGFENKCKKCRSYAKKKNHFLICLQCGKGFNSARANTKFCSKDCTGINRRKRVLRICNFCGEKVEVTISKSKRQDVFYCNQDCRSEDLKKLVGSKNPNFKRYNYKCDGCNIDIQVIGNRLKNQKYIFCSNECYKSNIGKYFSGINNSNFVDDVKVECSTCSKIFNRKPGQLKYKKYYCSKKCYMNAKERTEINGKIEISCSYCGNKFKIYRSKKELVKDIYCSMKCRNIHQGLLYRGANHPSFNPDLTEEERITNRKYTDYYLWRNKVYERDNYTCQCGEDSKGGNLVAHHILSYRSNKKAQILLDNGITLCKKCHKLFHDNFGYGNNDGVQFNNFLEVFDQFGESGFEDDI